MTGELTLRGRFSRRRHQGKGPRGAPRGITDVILPSRCKKDLEDVPNEIREKLTFHFVDDVDEVLKLALDLPMTILPPTRRRRRKRRRRNRRSCGRRRAPGGVSLRVVSHLEAEETRRLVQMMDEPSCIRRFGLPAAAALSLDLGGRPLFVKRYQARAFPDR